MAEFVRAHYWSRNAVGQEFKPVWPLNVALSKGNVSAQNVWRTVQQLLCSSELFSLILQSLTSMSSAKGNRIRIHVSLLSWAWWYHGVFVLKSLFGKCFQWYGWFLPYRGPTPRNGQLGFPRWSRTLRTCLYEQVTISINSCIDITSLGHCSKVCFS